ISISPKLVSISWIALSISSGFETSACTAKLWPRELQRRQSPLSIRLCHERLRLAALPYSRTRWPMPALFHHWLPLLQQQEICDECPSFLLVKGIQRR